MVSDSLEDLINFFKFYYSDRLIAFEDLVNQPNLFNLKSDLAFIGDDGLPKILSIQRKPSQLDITVQDFKNKIDSVLCIDNLDIFPLFFNCDDFKHNFKGEKKNVTNDFSNLGFELFGVNQKLVFASRVLGRRIFMLDVDDAGVLITMYETRPVFGTSSYVDVENYGGRVNTSYTYERRLWMREAERGRRVYPIEKKLI